MGLQDGGGRLAPRTMVITFAACLLFSIRWAELAAQDVDAAAAAPTTETAAPETAAPETAAPGTSDKAAAPRNESMLTWLIRTSGWIGAVILALSIYFVAAVLRGFVELRRSTMVPEELIAECEKLIESRDYSGLYRRVSSDDSFLGSVLTAGLTELRHGLSEAREAVERVGESLIAEMERKISMIAVLGTLGPMIGLLGTLKGMISSFSVIAMSDVQLRPSEVAGGISEALLLTFEGVGLSIPAIFFFALFRNRISAYSSDAIAVTDGFLRRISGTMRGKSGAGEPAAAGSAPPQA